MARISEQDAARLGLTSRIGGGTVARKTPAHAKIVSRSAATVSPRRPTAKNGRLPRLYAIPDNSPVIFTIVTAPLPKARARTSLPKAAIQKCFMQAHGNFALFTSLLEKVKHHSYTPDRTVSFEREIAIGANRAMAKSCLKPFVTPVEISIAFVFESDKDEWPTDQSDGDLDNLEKAVKDALNGIAYVDDRLVVRVTKEKRCGPVAQIEVNLFQAVATSGAAPI